MRWDSENVAECFYGPLGMQSNLPTKIIFWFILYVSAFIGSNTWTDVKLGKKQQSTESL